jgi:hypothetical protein
VAAPQGVAACQFGDLGYRFLRYAIGRCKDDVALVANVSAKPGICQSDLRCRHCLVSKGGYLGANFDSFSARDAEYSHLKWNLVKQGIGNEIEPFETP